MDISRDNMPTCRTQLPEKEQPTSCAGRYGGVNRTSMGSVDTSIFADAEEEVEPCNSCNHDNGDEEVQDKPVEVSVETVPATQENEEKMGGPTFNPPLYRQRYYEVAQALRKHNVKSVVDFGCAECKFMVYLKEISSVERAAGVDINQSLLESKAYMVKPLATDYVQRRENPLVIRLYAGDLAKFDQQFRDYDAVTMIEVIEHLEDDILKAFPHVLFGQMQPKVVVMTTPNSEFNVLFPNFTGFRHFDHKFEWTRAQFQTWCESVAVKFGYSVAYTGVGDPPVESDHLGHCSQMATFLLNQDSQYIPELNGEMDNEETYTLIAECTHPHRESCLTSEESVLQESEYYIRLLASDLFEEQDLDGVETDTVSVPLEKVLRFKKVQQFCKDVDTLREILLEAGHEATEDGLSVIYHRDCRESDLDSASNHSNQCDGFSQEEDFYHESWSAQECNTENWDDESDWTEQQNSITPALQTHEVSVRSSHTAWENTDNSWNDNADIGYHDNSDTGYRDNSDIGYHDNADIGYHVYCDKPPSPIDCEEESDISQILEDKLDLGTDSDENRDQDSVASGQFSDAEDDGTNSNAYFESVANLLFHIYS